MPPPRPGLPVAAVARGHALAAGRAGRAGGTLGLVVPHGDIRHRDRAAVDQQPAAQRRVAAEDAPVRRVPPRDRQVLEHHRHARRGRAHDLEDPVLPRVIPGWMIVRRPSPWPTIVSVLPARLELFWITIWPGVVSVST